MVKSGILLLSVFVVFTSQQGKGQVFGTELIFLIPNKISKLFGLQVFVSSAEENENESIKFKDFFVITFRTKSFQGRMIQFIFKKTCKQNKRFSNFTLIFNKISCEL